MLNILQELMENDPLIQYKNYDLKEMSKFGEVDIYGKFFFYYNDRLITACNLDLLQNSFSRRAWLKLPLDTYKGNGRLRHEKSEY